MVFATLFHLECFILELRTTSSVATSNGRLSCNRVTEKETSPRVYSPLKKPSEVERRTFRIGKGLQMTTSQQSRRYFINIIVFVTQNIANSSRYVLKNFILVFVKDIKIVENPRHKKVSLLKINSTVNGTISIELDVRNNDFDFLNKSTRKYRILLTEWNSRNKLASNSDCFVLRLLTN